MPGNDVPIGALDVAAVDWLLDAAAVAEHVGVSRAGLRSAHLRADGHVEGKSAPKWWRPPIGRIAGAHVWDLRDAEAMRVAYGYRRGSAAPE